MKQLSGKQMKRLKQLKKGMWKLGILYLLLDLFLAGEFLIGFYVNTPLVEQQLYTVSGKVEYAQSYEVTHIANLLIVKIDGREYTLSGIGRAERREYANYLSATKPDVTVTVVEYQPTACLIKGWRRTVAITDGQQSFDSSEKINRQIVQNRNGLIIFSIVIAVHLLPFEVIYFNLAYGYDYRELKRKQKKRAMQTETQSKTGDSTGDGLREPGRKV